MGAGRFDELIDRTSGQQVEADRGSHERHLAEIDAPDEERLGKRTRQKTAANNVSRAVKGVVGGELARWAVAYIPWSEAARGPLTTATEAEATRARAWGGGDLRAAKREMRLACKSPSCKKATKSRTS